MTPEINHHLSANAHMRRKDIMLGNFLGGLAWGFGSVVGATIVVAILLGTLTLVGYLPVIGGLSNEAAHSLTPKTK